MMALEVAATETWHGVDPAADTEYLVTAWSDGSRTVSSRVAYTGDAWGPAVELSRTGGAA